MGNTSSGHRRRPSLEDDFSASGNAGRIQDYADDQVISILTEGGAINALADQLRDPRIGSPGERAKLYVGDDAGIVQNVPTVFKWEGGGKDVYISGTFNGWKSKIPMVRSSSKHNFYTIVDLPLGEHQYKFIVDGQWKSDPNQPVTTSVTGVQNNVIEVKQSDFDVLTALSHDMASSRGGGGGGGGGTTGGSTATDDTPISPNPLLGHESVHDQQQSADLDSYLTGGHSPPGEYSRVIPSSPLAATAVQSDMNTSSAPPPISPHTHSSSEGKKVLHPPLLPPQLLQVILNRDTNVQCDPNLLPQPDHVMVNHMYALSIKDGVIVLSAITRYRQKFVSTVLYKPI